MKNDYWGALLKGLTPEKPAHVHVWWKAPVVILIVFFLTAAVL